MLAAEMEVERLEPWLTSCIPHIVGCLYFSLFEHLNRSVAAAIEIILSLLPLDISSSAPGCQSTDS